MMYKFIYFFVLEIIPQKIKVKDYWKMIGHNPNTQKETPQKQNNKVDAIVID